MCGIVGITGSVNPELINKMMAVIAARGPDGQERFSQAGMSFGFCRLSINDLSETGNQPMKSSDGLVVAMMNGEIYNAPELRKQLEWKGHKFRGKSDAEVIPNGYVEWGVDLFSRLRGMFAVAVFDLTKHRLLLARDHFGIKPLYFAETRDGVAFSSSARAVGLHPDVGHSLNHQAMSELVRYRYVQSGTALYQQVKVIPPGSVAVCEGRDTRIHTYWRRPRFSSDRRGSEHELIDQFSSGFLSSVKRELMSDVPLGILLSGGIDSGAVLCAAAKSKADNLIAYTLDLEGEASEVSTAAKAASEYGVVHRIVPRSEMSFVETFTRAVQCMDLPVGDAIIAPTYQLLGKVREERKVVLTGEGADELMAGYAHFRPLQVLDRAIRAGISPKAISGFVQLLPLRLLDSVFPYNAKLGESGKQKVLGIVRSGHDPRAALDSAVSIFTPDEMRTGTFLPLHVTEYSVTDLSLPTLIDWGFASWLPNQILNKMDQLSMAHGVEARVPFVDVDLYEIVSRLPLPLLLSRKGNKRVLREALKNWDFAGASIPKRAFYQPVTEKHIVELTSLAKEYLSESMVRKHGVFKTDLIREVLEKLSYGDFLAGKQVVALAAVHVWLEQSFRR